MKVRTNAKINLYLRVAGRRSDGYHDIETVFQTVDLADDMDVRAVDGGRFDVEIIFQGLPGRPPEPQENLAVRAARRLAAGAPHLGAVLRIVKRIPLGAGLAGGSANAAGALVALNELWGCGLTARALAAVGGDIGSDVPYMLSGGTVLATGRGDELGMLPAPAMWFVLGLHFDPLPTEQVYAAWDRWGTTAGAGGATGMAAALHGGDAAEVAGRLHNDLEMPAVGLRPEIGAGKQALLDAGALGACLSGSGPTVFAVARDEGHARALARRVHNRFDALVIAASAAAGVERLD